MYRNRIWPIEMHQMCPGITGCSGWRYAPPLNRGVRLTE